MHYFQRLCFLFYFMNCNIAEIMRFNKADGSRKNGFINILFTGAQGLQNHQPKPRDQQQFHKFIEQHVFMPRSNAKNIRIFKINDTLYTNFNTQKANRIKKMFVDGNHVRELTPNREMLTQDNARKKTNRLFSPALLRKGKQSRNQFLSFYEENCEQSLNKHKELQQQRQQQSPPQVLLMSMKQKSFEQSTTSSSIRNIRVSLRYRKPQNKSQPTKQIALRLKKEMLRYYSNPPCSPQNISAKSYIVYEHKSYKNQNNIGKCLHAAFNTKINVEIASLTKIMTCILTIQLCERFKVDLTQKFLKISQFQTKIEGTSAQLQPDQSYSIQQLLYGLMLPSGNDASLALSAFCGELLQKNVKGFSHQEVNKKYFSRKFVLQMNKKCNELGMKRTIYSNTHGLANFLNKSCASDQIILIHYALTNQIFRKIVSTKTYQAAITKYHSQEKKTTRNVKWENTHKLMLNRPELYFGIKTGTTDAAGPCLASLISIGGRQFIIIVLNCRSSKWRYKDTEQLRQWLCAKQKI